MGDVVNLNRFRKKRAREEKERRAQTNRRLHGRTKEERARDEADKERLEQKLDGAFLVREDVSLEEIPSGDAGEDLKRLDEAAGRAIPLSELSEPPSVSGDDD